MIGFVANGDGGSGSGSGSSQMVQGGNGAGAGGETAAAANSDFSPDHSSTKQPMTTANLDTALQNAFTTVNIFILILIMIAMGAKMKLKHIREHVQKPLGPLAGFLSQFVIMPLVAFVVAHLLRMKPAHAIGALIMACSPGGVMSNMVTYYTNGDCSLSITMTTLSTIIAFGMMPANLWLYTRSWVKGTSFTIPYTSILISLLLILIPVAVGYMFVMKYPHMRGVVAQTGSFSGILALVISMVLFTFMNINLIKISSVDIWIATAAMPVLGFVLGYLLSATFCLNSKQKRTVGFETGCQNASIAFSVISMSFPADIVSHVLLVPLLFCLFSFIEGWVFVIAWQTAKFVKRKVDEWKEDGWACVDWEESSDESEKEEEHHSGAYNWASKHHLPSFSALSSKIKKNAENALSLSGNSSNHESLHMSRSAPTGAPADLDRDRGSHVQNNGSVNLPPGFLSASLNSSGVSTSASARSHHHSHHSPNFHRHPLAHHSLHHTAAPAAVTTISSPQQVNQVLDPRVFTTDV